MANKRISQLDPANTLHDNDLFAVVQNTGSGLGTFKTTLNDLKLNIISTSSSLNYKGLWDASVTPHSIPPAGPANKGWYYVVSVGGVQDLNGAGTDDYQPKDWIVSNGTSWDKIDNSDNNASSELTDVTYNQLRSLMAAYSLIPGAFYRITDFQTIHALPETSIINTGPTEPLVCLAIDINRISGRVLSRFYPNDIIEYDPYDSQAEDTITSRPGKIIYRKDMVKNLETWYDFRYVKFRRWMLDETGGTTAWAPNTAFTEGTNVIYGYFFYKVLRDYTSSTNNYTDVQNGNLLPMSRTFPQALITYTAWRPVMNEFGGVIYANSGNFQDLLTFTAGCRNISVPKCNQGYNNIVFLKDTDNFVLGTNCTNMTLGGGSDYAIASTGNTIGNNCHGIILSYCDGVSIGYNSSGIIMKNVLGTTLGQDCHEIFMDTSSKNYIGNFVTKSGFGPTVNNSRLEDSTSKNLIHSGTSSKIDIGATYNYVLGSRNYIGFNSTNNNLLSADNSNIGTNCSNNKLQGTDNCSIGANSTGNQITQGTLIHIGISSNNNIVNQTENCSIGNASGNNQIIQGATNNQIGNNCQGNIFKSGAYNNQIGDACNTNTFQFGANSNVLDEGSINNLFTNEAAKNKLGLNCNANTFQSTANSNILEGGASNNTFGTGSSNNKLGLNSSYNTFMGVASANILHQNCSNNVIGVANYSATVNNIFMQGCNNIQICGSNNIFEPNCTFITTQNSLIITQCYFASGVGKISILFNTTMGFDASILSSLKIMHATSNASVITLTHQALTPYNDLTFDMIDSLKNLWARVIDTAGVISTIKLQ